LLTLGGGGVGKGEGENFLVFVSCNPKFRGIYK
jgi:hypothetical protein